MAQMVSYPCVASVALPDNSSTTGFSTEQIRIDSTNMTLFSQHATLGNVSGTALYTTTVVMGSNPHAMIDLGVCSHTCNVTVNGKPATPVNPIRPIVDVSELLVAGENEIQVEVSTPLGNFLR